MPARRMMDCIQFCRARLLSLRLPAPSASSNAFLYLRPADQKGHDYHSLDSLRRLVWKSLISGGMTAHCFSSYSICK